MHFERKNVWKNNARGKTTISLSLITCVFAYCKEVTRNIDIDRNIKYWIQLKVIKKYQEVSKSIKAAFIRKIK